MTEKKYVKRIGWVVEFRVGRDPGNTWNNLNDSKARTSKSVAIGDFNKRCQFYYIPVGVVKNRTAYGWLKRRSLARCVPLYVEVHNAKD